MAPGRQKAPRQNRADIARTLVKLSHKMQQEVVEHIKCTVAFPTLCSKGGPLMPLT